MRNYYNLGGPTLKGGQKNLMLMEMVKSLVKILLC
jgi:hypothetical protein